MSLKKILTILTATFISFSLFSTEPVPAGYCNIKLGMSLDSTKSELQKNPDFGYHGDRDVSLIPGSNKILIELKLKLYILVVSGNGAKNLTRKIASVLFCLL